MKSRIFHFLCMMFLGVLVGACHSDSVSPSKKDAKEKVLAEIGKDVITLKRFQEFYENLPQEFLLRFQGESGKKALLDQLIELKMYARRAEQLGIDKDPEIRRRIEESRDKILATAFHIKEITEKITVSDEEIRNYYELHKQEHIRPEQVKVREIVVMENKDAEDIIKLLTSGASFESLAVERSVDRSHGASGGNLGWQQRGQGEMINPVEDLAFSLNKGEIGGPIKAQNGYHIIKVEDRLDTYQRTLEETYEPIKNKIRNMKQRERMAQVKAEVEQEMKVKTNWDLLQEIPDRQPDQPFPAPGAGGPGAIPGAPASPPLPGRANP